MEEERVVRGEGGFLASGGDGGESEAGPGENKRGVAAIDFVIADVDSAEGGGGDGRGEAAVGGVGGNHGTEHEGDFGYFDDVGEVVVVAGTILVGAGFREKQVEYDGLGTGVFRILDDGTVELARPRPAKLHGFIDGIKAGLIDGDDDDIAAGLIFLGAQKVEGVVEEIVSLLEGRLGGGDEGGEEGEEEGGRGDGEVG